jgi:hypothetical protein
VEERAIQGVCGYPLCDQPVQLLVRLPFLAHMHGHAWGRGR